MTKQEYADYRERFFRFMEREFIEVFSTELDPETGDCPDPHFSHSPCEVCRRPLGGNRYKCVARQAESVGGLFFRFDACEDCVYFEAYGRLDDMTMLEIERSAD